MAGCRAEARVAGLANALEDPVRAVHHTRRADALRVVRHERVRACMFWRVLNPLSRHPPPSGASGVLGTRKLSKSLKWEKYQFRENGYPKFKK